LAEPAAGSGADSDLGEPASCDVRLAGGCAPDGKSATEPNGGAEAACGTGDETAEAGWAGGLGVEGAADGSGTARMSPICVSRSGALA